MKAIIYTTESSATTALNKCNTIAQGEVTNVGEGPFVQAEPKPYTSFFKHPAEQKWALMADSKVEEKLNKTAVELPADWFPVFNAINHPPQD